jgi:hypothetical protein
MLTKTQVHSALETLPEKFPIEQLIDKLLFIENVEKGLQQSRGGHVYTKEQALEKLTTN